MKANCSTSTKIKLIVKQIDDRIRAVFNRDFFSIYEGIIEQIDRENATLTVRIPQLDDTVYDNCRILMPCSTPESFILPDFKVNSTVIVGFQAFNLKYPVILGQISPVTAVNAPIETDTIKIKNGSATLEVTPAGVKIKVGNSMVLVTEWGVTIDADNAVAGDNNLLVDDIGVL